MPIHLYTHFDVYNILVNIYTCMLLMYYFPSGEWKLNLKISTHYKNNHTILVLWHTYFGL